MMPAGGEVKVITGRKFVLQSRDKVSEKLKPEETVSFTAPSSTKRANYTNTHTHTHTRCPLAGFPQTLPAFQSVCHGFIFRSSLSLMLVTFSKLLQLPDWRSQRSKRSSLTQTMKTTFSCSIYWFNDIITSLFLKFKLLQLNKRKQD